MKFEQLFTLVVSARQVADRLERGADAGIYPATFLAGDTVDEVATRMRDACVSLRTMADALLIKSSFHDRRPAVREGWTIRKHPRSRVKITYRVW